MDIKSTFIKGKMNKSVDERLVPPGEYINALNVRLGSTEISEIGAVENSKGNTNLTTELPAGKTELSQQAICIGSYADSTNNTLYWFVHDNAFNVTQIADVIFSYNTDDNILTQHFTSIGVGTTLLNFNPKYLITGISKIDDLLFFTDNFNPPRFINVNRNYSGGEDISVIQKPPGFKSGELVAPDYNLFNSSFSEENYLKDKFLSFAYRFKYQDNQYSATSLFSDAAFEPGEFDLDYASRENLGMTNKFNGTQIKVSTGGENVVAFDILFKESNSNIIFVLDTINKESSGIPNNSFFTYTLTSKKIYSTLGSDELLRQYDNVPLIAQAQVIQGNRLMYGNYEDGRDISLANGQPIDVRFSPTIISNPIRTVNLLPPVQQSNTQFTQYDINTFQSQIVGGAGISFSFLDSTGAILPEFQTGVPIGTVFNLSLAFQAALTTSLDPASPPADFPIGYQPFNGAVITIGSQWITSQDYGSIEDMLNGNDFAAMIGTAIGTTLKPIQTAPNSQLGNTLTDKFNALIKNTSPKAAQYIFNFPLNLSGISSSTTDQPLNYIVNPTGFLITPNAVRFLTQNPYSNTTVFSYFRFVASASSISYGSATNAKSLHSNRDYDAAIVYMDDYGRATPAISSLLSSTHIAAKQSVKQNIMQVSVHNPPPPWASKYKFVLKPSATEYNTLFVTRYYRDRIKPDIIWFKLEGDQKNIITEGMKLIVKADNSGPLNVLLEETVLEVKAYAADELGPAGGKSLEGLYFSIQGDLNVESIQTTASFMYNKRAAKDENTRDCDTQVIARTVLFPTVDIDAGNITTWVNYTIPAGTQIKIEMRIWRAANTDGVQTVDWRWNQKYISPTEYQSFREWWIGEDIGNLVAGTSNTGVIKPVGYYEETPVAFGDTVPDNAPYYGCNTYTIGWKEVQSVGSGLYWMYLSHGCPLQGPFYDKSPSNCEIRIKVNRENDLVIFETTPNLADPNLFYDSSESYDIVLDANNELSHSGNVQNQELQSLTPAIVNLPFFNCFTFGNGVESIKILDLPTEVSVNLGERTTAVATGNIKRAHRFASITYSGIFQGQTNLNNTNEFNLGLVNYRDYENSFGSIMKLHDRETDILVLQEDRISYVLTSKNLISDSTGGGAITSVPEVLGTQIARIEEFGISRNPESFTHYGKDMYFADAKRNAILKLSGGSIKSDALEVVSEYGMRSYFRDSFIGQLNTQKLGGYDPYMGEYVFSNTDISLPQEEKIIPCGTDVSKINTTKTFTFSYKLSPTVSTVDVDIAINNTTSNVTLSAVWNGTSVINATTHPGSVNITQSPSTPFTFTKSLHFPQILEVTIVANQESSYELTVNCPTVVVSNVTRLILSTNLNAGKTLHTAYMYRDLTPSPPFDSPEDEIPITLSSVSTTALTHIDTTAGQQSTGIIPYDGTRSVVNVSKLAGDTYDYNVVENKIYVFKDTTPGGVKTETDFINEGGVTILQGQTPIAGINFPDKYQVQTPTDLSSFGSNDNLLVVIDLRDFNYAATFVGIPGFPLNCSAYSNQVTQYTFDANSDPMPSQFQACNLNLNALPTPQTKKTFAHRGVNSGTPRVGDPCQVSSGSNVRMPPGWYKISGNRVIQIGTGTQRGIVINKINC